MQVLCPFSKYIFVCTYDILKIVYLCKQTEISRYKIGAGMRVFQSLKDDFELFFILARIESRTAKYGTGEIFFKQAADTAEVGCIL